MSQPNILMIMSDQHHKSAMSCAGHPVVRTPHLDALARRATRFTQAICNFPLCGPSRASFMTGRHPHETEVWTNDGEYRGDMPTFAHAFGAAGYEAVLSGRMHFVGGDQRHGFERRLISDCGATSWIARGWNLPPVLGELSDTPGMSRASLEKSGAGRSGYLEYDENVTAATVRYLRERAAEPASVARPLLLTVGYAMPHCPFVADPADFAPYVDATPEPTLTEVDLAHLHAFVQAQRKQFGSSPLPSAATMRRIATAYYGMVTHLDRQVGQVIQALEDAGMADNTIIVYTSDHGEQLGEHGCWWKSTFYEGAIGVPLLMALPGGSATAGQSVAANVSLMDIGPTLLDLAGVAPLPGASGRSFRSVLEGRADGWRDEAFAENIAFTADGMPMRMLKCGTWKYNYYHGLPPELYNLEDDPAEDHDLAGCPEHADRLAAMRATALNGWDPDDVARRIARRRAESRLCGAWQRLKNPAEPDVHWITTPPQNYLI